MNQAAIDSIKAERDAIKREYMAHAEKMDRERDAMAQEIERLTEGWRVSNNDVLHKALEIERLREALNSLVDASDESDSACYGTLSTRFVRDIARAALKETK